MPLLVRARNALRLAFCGNGADQAAGLLDAQVVRDGIGHIQGHLSQADALKIGAMGAAAEAVETFIRVSFREVVSVMQVSETVSIGAPCVSMNMIGLSRYIFFYLDNSVRVFVQYRTEVRMMPKKGERVKEVTVTVTRKLKQFEKTCPVCQRRFWGAKISRYCSRACLNKANYDRHAEQYRKARMDSYRRQKERDATE